ncbi:hypothetical protein [Flavobacterium psychraquaticum]|uniref:hypothetical protein n=1 Tax=Flavobacterium psychraquaticum TaxID=3103958 RepID=UPI002ACE4B37|nr:hypothetical protein [Flavobacterium sp. LB-N7T]
MRLPLLLLLFCTLSYAQIGIGTTTPNAALDITATNDGLLIPRVALVALNNVSPLTLPTISEMVYNTATAGTAPNNVTPGYYYWNGTSWSKLAITTNTSWSTAGNAGTNPATNYIGTADATDMVFRANNLERMRIISSNGNISIGDAVSGTIRSNKELVLRQDGDTYGSSVLRLRNRNAENGAIFENLNPTPVGTNLVDFIFRTGTTATPIASNIRFETRTSSLKVSGNTTEWQFGQPDNLNGGPTLVVGASGTGSVSAFLTGRVGIGTSTPRAALDVSSSTNGILIPQVSLTSSSVEAPVVNPATGALVIGTMVYNSQTTGDVTPGYYYWTGTKWSRFATNATAGTTLNTAMININVGGDATISSTTFAAIADFTYTPVSNNSTIIVEFNTKYEIGGYYGDSYSSQITVDGSQIVYSTQTYTNANGGGTRSNTLLPLMGGYTNTSLTPKTINIRVKRDSGDDNAVFKRDASTWLKITEIAR